MARIKDNIENCENTVIKCKYASVTGKFELEDNESQRDDQSQSGISLNLRM